MRVLLVDIDSKIPNLALMKIAAYHRRGGDEVGFNIEDPAKIYASVVFKKNAHRTRPTIFWTIDFSEYVE